ncbi:MULTISPECIES: glycosyltransferase family 25 protein [unclassified Caballeronia]|uniref:glycosyltransferase family 25 protein n=1 Tax=unclassified Caballeronia TaxID=2646786 RepID=UPI002859A0F7|nr:MULTISPECIES: glycosyltransferase family 25 protein [unclassified Caballeronia]MDR5771132.1 glycosyltransferase family 25 protein [Caballeronia sp. LZ002]MDR5846569.1 glycosyltransferase family 25 protein [Caballeronia sp. LZ003]
MMLEGRFINLERSQERRQSIEAQLKQLGCADWITRFPAIDGRANGPFDNAAENSVWACRQSHTEAILNSEDDSAVLILEDDVELSRYFPSILNEATLNGFVDSFPNCDVLFLDCVAFRAQTPYLLSLAEGRLKNRLRSDALEVERHALSTVSIIDARGVFAYCAASYVVTPKGKKTLHRLFSDDKDANAAVDILYRDWIASGQLNANITVPFIATPEFQNISTIPYEQFKFLHLNMSDALLANAIRRLLFAGEHRLDMAKIAVMIGETESSPEYTLGMKLYETSRSSDY